MDQHRILFERVRLAIDVYGVFAAGDVVLN